MQAYREMKVRKMYPWQAAAVECGQRSNLVFCAPTSGGKSLVAEVLLIQRLVATAARHQVRLFLKRLRLGFPPRGCSFALHLHGW